MLRKTLLCIAIVTTIVSFVWYFGKPQDGVKVRINWIFDLPSCSSKTTENCALFINVVAFKQDGSMITVATQLPPTAKDVDTTLPTMGVYDFWVIASIYDSNGKFKILPGEEIVNITKMGATPLKQEQPSDSNSWSSPSPMTI